MAELGFDCSLDLGGSGFGGVDWASDAVLFFSSGDRFFLSRVWRNACGDGLGGGPVDGGVGEERAFCDRGGGWGDLDCAERAGGEVSEGEMAEAFSMEALVSVVGAGGFRSVWGFEESAGDGGHGSLARTRVRVGGFLEKRSSVIGCCGVGGEWYTTSWPAGSAQTLAA